MNISKLLVKTLDITVLTRTGETAQKHAFFRHKKTPIKGVCKFKWWGGQDWLRLYTTQRISSTALEKIVLQMIKASLLQKNTWLNFLSTQDKDLLDEQILHKLQHIIWSFDSLNKSDQQLITKQLISKIIILNDSLTIKLNSTKIEKIVSKFDIANTTSPLLSESVPSLKLSGNDLEISLSICFENINRRKQAVDENGNPIKMFAETNYDMTLIKTLAKSYRWNKMLESGEVKSITELAKLEKAGRGRVSKIINFMTLSPEIITAILNGKQNPKLSTELLLQSFPESWEEQKAIYFIKPLQYICSIY